VVFLAARKDFPLKFYQNLLHNLTKAVSAAKIAQRAARPLSSLCVEGSKRKTDGI